MKCVSFYRECSAVLVSGLHFDGPFGALTSGKAGKDPESCFCAHGVFRCNACRPLYPLIEVTAYHFCVFMDFCSFASTPLAEVDYRYPDIGETRVSAIQQVIFLYIRC